METPRFLIKYNPPVSKAGILLATTPQSSTPSGPNGQAPTPKRSRSPARAQKAEPRASFSDRSPKGDIWARESGSGRRRPRSRSRGKKSVNADAISDENVRETRTAAWRAG